MGSERAGRRDRLVLDTFVELTSTLSTDYEIGEFLRLLVDRCGEALSADTAGVMLETESGRLQLVAAVSGEMEIIEQAEVAAGQGPCVEAYRTRAQVLVMDLAEERERWPDVVPQLLGFGMQSGYGFPLKTEDDCIGALNLYRREKGRLDEGDIRLAQALADVATIGILQQRKVRAAEDRADHLARALSSRIVIEQAKGILANQHDETPQQAFDRLRTYARHNRLRLHDLAQQLIDGTAPHI